VTEIESDATTVLQALVRAEDEDAASGGSGVVYLEGPKLQEATELPPIRINRAVGFLEDYGMVDVEKFMGTAPFDFGMVRATSAGRHALQAAEEEAARQQTPGGTPMPTGQKVFLVHGRDDSVREKVARVLERLGLDVVILAEQANEGRTLIEKFEQNALDVGFAVVLLTADDVGHYKDEPRPSQANRARQNVILELGYFMAKLGRSRLVAMIAEGVEQPTDILGIAYLKLDPDAAWRLTLAQELRAAGWDVDLNRLVSPA
jgi:predicted nucleotide-binding protein